ncbi:LytR/AlgR family response regulator transcription factor [Spirosoma flavum]|uniref:LytR/AlgR family response regulator transcription factor n=1 Tax=Spirosoma flavum TaxID=2048557 RepID=A0ABW6ARB5_9BACT
MSTKIRCLIIDDEPLSQDLLIEYVERTPVLELAGTANNGQQALLKCQSLQPELLLLDIRMPRLSGFEFLDLLPKPTPLVVITSAYREYALKGYEHAVVDFLEKPIFPDRFGLAIQRVEERLEHSRWKQVNNNPGEGSDTGLGHKMLTVRVDRNQVNLPLDTINFIESLDNYVKIHLTGQPAKTLVSKVTVSQLDNKLPQHDFLRINRKYIVRIDQINVFTSNSIKLFTGDELPIGTTFRDAVRQALNDRGVN